MNILCACFSTYSSQLHANTRQQKSKKKNDMNNKAFSAYFLYDDDGKYPCVRTGYKKLPMLLPVVIRLFAIQRMNVGMGKL